MSGSERHSPSPSGEGLGWGSEKLAHYAKALRKNPTEPEIRLWRHLSNSQLGGHKFRRQQVIGPYIADFFCPALGLIVEVDGDTHNPKSDAQRDADLARYGLTTLRFTNADVMHNIEGVLQHILTTAMSLPSRRSWRLPHPNPSPEGEGLR